MSKEFIPRAFMPAYPGLGDDREIERWLQGISVSNEAYEPWIASAIKHNHSKGGRSSDTFNGIRGELERFLLYLMSEDKRPDEVDASFLSKYMLFCQNPSEGWVTSQKARRFDEYGVPDLRWRPFYDPSAPKFGPDGVVVRQEHRNDTNGTSNHGFSQAAINRRFSFLKLWYDDLVEEEKVARNPVPRAIKNSSLTIFNTDEDIPNSFTKSEWRLIFKHLVAMANEDPRWERSLFIILLMKSCYLRVSDICSRPHFVPIMSHFYQHEGYWFLRVMSKGKKIRSVSVPEAFLDYLIRYRESRGLSGLPAPNEKSLLVAKHKGKGGVGRRHMSRLIKEAFQEVCKRLERNEPLQRKKPHLIPKIESAVTHILRHTGASIDAIWRPIPELAEEMGHADPATTGRKYIHSQRGERAKRGSKRSLA